jgi:hypothetical protein
MEETKYTIDVFTEQSVGTKFPENSYFVNELASVKHIIKHCTREEAGIRQVQVWINKPTDNEEVEELVENPRDDFYCTIMASLLDRSIDTITVKERNKIKKELHVLQYGKGVTYGKD